MHLLMAEKANQLLHKYQIKDFPIPIDIIEQIICNEGIGIEITKYLKKALYYECGNNRTIFIGYIRNEKFQRELLVHEAAHMYHCGNVALLDPIVIDKNESQAQAFAAYFLMPIGIFEKYWAQNESDYALAEAFGVMIELVQFRKKLGWALWEAGEYERLRYDKFF